MYRSLCTEMSFECAARTFEFKSVGNFVAKTVLV